MGKPSAPTPPDPRQTASASESTNVGTGVANAFLNNVNQVTPYGSLNYNQTGNYNWNDPYTGNTYNIPQFTATQTLTPQQTATLGQTEGAQYNLANLANTQSGRLGSLLSTNLDLSSAPAAGTAADLTPTTANRTAVETALFNRINPQLDRTRSQIEQRLSDQGIRYGSQAYTSAMDDYNRHVGPGTAGDVQCQEYGTRPIPLGVLRQSQPAHQ
jgi:isocitrate lyase